MFTAVVWFLLVVSTIASAEEKTSELKSTRKNDIRSLSEAYVTRGFDWVSDKFFGTIDSFIPEGRTARFGDIEERKKKKNRRLNKYIFPMIVGFLLIKSLMLPLVLKALAVISGKAIVLSFMSLILSAIIGIRSLVGGGGGGGGGLGLFRFGIPAQSKTDLYGIPSNKYDKRKDLIEHAEQVDEDPYRYYPERRRRRR